MQTATDLDGTEVVTRNTYDPVGHLKMTVVSSGEVSDTTMHTYNVRGWQTSIENDSWSSAMRYQNPEFEESDASFTGNISEWEWTRGNSTDTYSLEYDALSRIKESRLFRNGNPVDALSESGISYDSNGNILSLTRTGEDGSAVNDLTYHYDGNRLECLVDNGELSGNYAYDADGNMTFDGRTGMSLSWNDLGLVEKVSLNDTDLVNYSYLADGTKVSAQNSDGDGLLYLGSLIYRKQGESLTLESAGFAGGRFVAREDEVSHDMSMVPMFHVTDHLGSVRAVVDGVSGEVVETNDYYPFGSRWNTTASLTDNSNRFRYNGKEEQSSLYPASLRNAAAYIDYGARQYDPILGRWFAQDPFAENYYGISPYAFCAGNPVKYLDPDGERQWPVNPTFKGESRRISDGFKTPSRPSHKGIDINIGSGSHDLGAPVIATHDGTIDRLRSFDDNDGGGNRILITSVDGTVSTYYMHLNSFANIKKGDFVKEGIIIGYIGGSGKGSQNEYSPHLHYEIIVDGKHIDPVIREDILVDPQKINEPIHMGDLQSSYIEANSKPLPILNCILEYSACGLAL